MRYNFTSTVIEPQKITQELGRVKYQEPKKGAVIRSKSLQINKGEML